jgi:hypothetical protein
VNIENIEEVFFDYILSGLIIHEKKDYKKLAKKLLKRKNITINSYYGSSLYTYNNGTVHLKAKLKDSTEYQHHISHPISSNKRAEVQNCVYDLAWLDAHVLKYLNLQEQPQKELED